MEAIEASSNSSAADRASWHILGKSVPKQEVVYFCQVILIYIVVISCIVNLILQRDDGKVWISLLSACLGYLLPNPSIKTVQEK